MAADQNQNAVASKVVTPATAKAGAKVHWMKHSEKAKDLNGVIVNVLENGKLVIEWTWIASGKTVTEVNDMSRVLEGHLEKGQKAISVPEFLEKNPTAKLSRF